MKKPLLCLVLGLAMAFSILPAHAEDVYYTVRLPGYDRKSYVVDQTAQYDLLPAQDGSGVFRGYVDGDGRLALILDYDDGRLFHDGLAMVSRGDKCGYINNRGEVVIPLRYAGATDFSQGRASVALPYGSGYRWSLIDKTGQVCATYPSISPPAEGRARFRGENGKWGFLDLDGNVVVPAVYDFVADFSQGRAWVGMGDADTGRYGFIDLSGQLVIPMEYDYAGCRVLFSEGLAQVTRLLPTGKLAAGYIDLAGKVVVPLEYAPTVSEEKDPRAMGCVGGSVLVKDADTGICSLLNSKGELVADLYASSASGPFRDGWVTYAAGGKVGAVRAGASIPAQYSYCGGYQDGYIVVEKDGLLGVVNGRNQTVVPFQYQDVLVLPGGKILVSPFTGQRQGRFFLYGSPTAPVITPQYAYPSTQAVEIDGVKTTVQMYAILNSDGYQTNFVRVRDVAWLLKDTPAKFNVGWAWSAIWLTPHEGYAPNGSEMSAVPFSDARPYQIASELLYLNKQPADLAAILLKDDAGNGYTYIKLRDLGRGLGFNVGWSGQRGVYIETNKTYQG